MEHYKPCFKNPTLLSSVQNTLGKNIISLSINSYDSLEEKTPISLFQNLVGKYYLSLVQNKSKKPPLFPQFGWQSGSTIWEVILII